MVDLGKCEARRAPADRRRRQGHNQARRLIGGLAGLIFGMAASGVAKAVECKELTDPAARLACYDTRDGRTAAAQASDRSPTQRAAYAEQLRRLLLGNGVSMTVMHQEILPANSVRKESARLFPRLLLYGYLDDSFVFQMITTGKLLDKANALGFQSVEFFSKGSQGLYTYDLTGPTTPACDIKRRVCI